MTLKLLFISCLKNGIVQHQRNITFLCTKLNKMEGQACDWRAALHSTMRVIPDFVTPQEETALLEEVEPYMKRLRYEGNHWDDAIHNYRETERSTWNEHNMKIIDRMRKTAFPPDAAHLGPVHVLDLAANGWIKPHIDSVRFCGDVIAGLSLLTDCVMRLAMVEHEKERVDDFLLPRRSLYIMSGVARYDYKHEILKNEDSYYQGQHIQKDRRISIICRMEPNPTSES